MSDEEWAQLMAQRDSSWDTIPNDHQYYIYQGSWNFDIPVTVDTSRTQLIEVNDVNDAGLGIESILLTPYELEITGQYPEDQMGSFFLVALDADETDFPIMSLTAVPIISPSRIVTFPPYRFSSWIMYSIWMN